MRLKSGNTVARGRHPGDCRGRKARAGTVRMCRARYECRGRPRASPLARKGKFMRRFLLECAGHGTTVGAGPVPARLPERANSGDNALEKCSTTYAVAGVRAGTGPAPTVTPNSPHGRKARGLPLQSHPIRRTGPAPTVRRGKFPRTHQLMRRRSFPISSAWARSAEELRRSSVQRSGLLRIYSTTY